jgi:7,8-dihydropterin-6-yl-methyl-4-(beta-D-ribofuranosyl)aminobenzene 5'-phosphate synthase
MWLTLLLNSGSGPLGNELGTKAGTDRFWTRVHGRKEQKMLALLALPAIDGVEITTIIDNTLDLLMASTPVAHRFPVHRELFSPHQLRTEHGVSLLVTVLNQGKRDTLLFATGVTPDGVLHNLALLGVDLGNIQAIVLSYGHPDHTRGLSGLLDHLGKRCLPILLHPDAFLKRRLVVDDQVSIDLPPPSLHNLSRGH